MVKVRLAAIMLRWVNVLDNEQSRCARAARERYAIGRELERLANNEYLAQQDIGNIANIGEAHESLRLKAEIDSYNHGWHKAPSGAMRLRVV